MQKASVSAILVEDIDAALDKPGAFEIWPDGLAYVCPCGCKAVGFLPFKPCPSPSWAWDGNRERPTLTPSVHHMIGEPPVTHWHGWLRAGVWEAC